MSCSVAVDETGSLRITCDDGADTVRIVEDSQNIHVSFDQGEPQTFTAVHTIDIQTLGGPDTLDIMLAADGAVTRLLADLGDGGDTADIAIESLEIAHEGLRREPVSASLILGEGEDRVDVRVQPGTPQDSLGTEVEIQPSLSFGAAAPAAHIAIAQADGGQAVGVLEIVGAENVGVETGAGNDRIRLDNGDGLLQRIHFELNAGAGDDEWLYVPVRRFSLFVEQSLHEGTEWAVFDGNRGDDRLTIITGDRAESIDIHGTEQDVPDPQIHITDKETGLLTAMVQFVNTEAAHLDTAGGDDELAMRGDPNQLANIQWALHTGEGNDEVAAIVERADVRSPPALRFGLQIDVGEGSDRIHFDWSGVGAVPREFDLELLLGQVGLAPEAGDEVLIAFEYGDVRAPVILGALWNSNDRPPTDSNREPPPPRRLRLHMSDPGENADPPGEQFFHLIGGGSDDNVDASYVTTAGGGIWNVDLGEGDNTLDLNAARRSLSDDVKPAEFKPAEFHIGSGSGHDVLRVRTTLDAHWNLLTGAGHDDVTIDAPMGDLSADSHFSIDVDEGDNTTRLRFGDGQHGRRLPTGSTNVTARYRSGAGKDSVTYDWLVHRDRPLVLGFDAFTGAGDDNVKVNVQHPFASSPTDVEFLIHSGAGDDVVLARMRAVDGKVGAAGGTVKGTLSGDVGSDSLALLAFLPSTVETYLVADGGPDSDHGIVTAPVRARDIERLVVLGEGLSAGAPRDVASRPLTDREPAEHPGSSPGLAVARRPLQVPTGWEQSSIPLELAAHIGQADPWEPERVDPALEQLGLDLKTLFSDEVS